jgi:hypothetical protein
MYTYNPWSVEYLYACMTKCWCHWFTYLEIHVCFCFLSCRILVYMYSSKNLRLLVLASGRSRPPSERLSSFQWWMYRHMCTRVRTSTYRVRMALDLYVGQSLFWLIFSWFLSHSLDFSLVFHPKTVIYIDLTVQTQIRLLKRDLRSPINVSTDRFEVNR